MKTFIPSKPFECGNCGKPATRQTANGAYQQEIGALPQNWGWYCYKCYDEGLKRENEAIYG